MCKNNKIYSAKWDDCFAVAEEAVGTASPTNCTFLEVFVQHVFFPLKQCAEGTGGLDFMWLNNLKHKQISFGKFLFW